MWTIYHFDWIWHQTGESEVGIVRLGLVPVSKSSHPAGASARFRPNNIYSSAWNYQAFSFRKAINFLTAIPRWLILFFSLRSISAKDRVYPSG